MDLENLEGQAVAIWATSAVHLWTSRDFLGDPCKRV